jgi:hypothetical protein
VRGTSPEEFGKATREQFALYRNVIQSNHIKAD